MVGCQQSPPLPPLSCIKYLCIGVSIGLLLSTRSPGEETAISNGTAASRAAARCDGERAHLRPHDPGASAWCLRCGQGPIRRGDLSSLWPRGHSYRRADGGRRRVPPPRTEWSPPPGVAASPAPPRGRNGGGIREKLELEGVNGSTSSWLPADGASAGALPRRWRGAS